jgi:hypothetical protein
MHAGQQLLKNPSLENDWYTISLNNGDIKGALPGSWEENTNWDATARIVYSKDSANPFAGASSLKAVVSRSRMQVVQVRQSNWQDCRATFACWLPAPSLLLQLAPNVSQTRCLALAQLRP